MALSFTVLEIRDDSKDRQEKMADISQMLEGCTGQNVAAKRPTLFTGAGLATEYPATRTILIALHIMRHMFCGGVKTADRTGKVGVIRISHIRLTLESFAGTRQ